MDIKRMIASALVRRLVYVAVALLLAWLGLGKAHAAAGGGHATKQVAYEHCQAWAATAGYNYERCIDHINPAILAVQAQASTNGSGWSDIQLYYYTVVCPTGQNWDAATKTCEAPPTCEDVDPVITFPGNMGSTMCRTTELGPGITAGCEFVATFHPDGSGYAAWQGVGPCNPNDYDCPGPGYALDLDSGYCVPIPECAGYKDPTTGDCIPPGTCPPGQHKGPDGFCVVDPQNCPAGQIKAPDGTCVPDTNSCGAGQARGADGSCKPDADGDGNPDGTNDDGTFSGGESCTAPPVCIGDNIMCGQARIQWRIDCNTRKNATISGGACDAMPVCTGEGCDERLHKLQIMEWRTACAVEKLAKESGGTAGTPGDANGNGQPDWTENPGDGMSGNIGAEGDPAGVWAQEAVDPIGHDGLDDTGMGYARTCPTIPTVNVFGQSLTFDTSVVCNWMLLSGQFVLILAGLASLRLIAGGI